MIKMKFSIIIKSDAKKIWHVLWDEDMFRQWSMVFDPKSHMISTLEEGTPVKFIGTGGMGVYGKVIKHIKNESILFQYEGELENGKEKPFTDSPFHKEEYKLLKNKDDTYILNVDLTTIKSYKKMLEEKMPLALNNIKELSEKKS